MARRRRAGGDGGSGVGEEDRAREIRGWGGGSNEEALELGFSRAPHVLEIEVPWWWPSCGTGGQALRWCWRSALCTAGRTETAGAASLQGNGWRLCGQRLGTFHGRRAKPTLPSRLFNVLNAAPGSGALAAPIAAASTESGVPPHGGPKDGSLAQQRRRRRSSSTRASDFLHDPTLPMLR